MHVRHNLLESKSNMFYQKWFAMSLLAFSSGERGKVPNWNFQVYLPWKLN